MKQERIRDIILMLVLALITGILAGFGAIVFRGLVAFFHNLLFSGRLSVIYFENLHTPPGVLGAGIILVPVLGGMAVIWLIEHFAHDERGLSVPEIMNHIRHHDEKAKPISSLAKNLASAISIGSGASIGREGPVVQLGAAISSLICDLISLTAPQRKLLVAAGVAAGTAAIFSAPFTGMVFSMELFLPAFTIPAIVLIVIAATTATSVVYMILGSEPLFSVHAVFPINADRAFLLALALFLISGIITGLISTLFIKWIYRTEDAFNHFFKNSYLRHMAGMFMIGIMIYLCLRFLGHYYVEGVGFATIQDCLNMVLTNPWLLLLIFCCKFLATCLSLGSGASGGIFSPALFLGATSGSVLGIAFNHLFPGMEINPSIFALAGMAAMVGSTTGAVITAILLAFEITGSVQAFLPVLIMTVSAYVIRRKLCHESVYTLKLVRRGIHL